MWINKKVYLILGGILLVLLFILFVLPSLQTNNTQLTNNQSKQYYSKLMKFYITIPEGFNVEDKGVSLVLSRENGTIVVDRNGTNYENLYDYISFFDSKRDLEVVESEKMEIDGNQALQRIETFPKQGVKEKVYFIYVNSFVIIFSTQSESLYDDLDQIAQSFRYTP